MYIVVKKDKGVDGGKGRVEARGDGMRKTTVDTKYKTHYLLPFPLDVETTSFSKVYDARSRNRRSHCPKKLYETLHSMRALARKNERPRHVDSIRLSTGDSPINYTALNSEETSKRRGRER